METKKIEIAPIFRYAWETFKKDFWYFVAIAVIYIILSGIATGVDNDSFLMSVLSMLITAWLTAGLLRIMIDIVRGTKHEITELFNQGKYFLQILLANIVIGILIVVGLVFFIVPGIYFAIRYMFVPYLIVDKNLDLSAAMTESSRMTDGIKMDLFVFGVVSFGIGILGLIVFGIGIFIAMPVIWLATSQLYVQRSTHTEPADTNDKAIQ